LIADIIFIYHDLNIVKLASVVCKEVARDESISIVTPYLIRCRALKRNVMKGVTVNLSLKLCDVIYARTTPHYSRKGVYFFGIRDKFSFFVSFSLRYYSLFLTFFSFSLLF